MIDAVRMEDVTFRYFAEGKRNILDHVSLSIPQDGITVLTGDSGCGKSTLAAVIAGLYPENGGVLLSGTIRLFDQPLETLDPQKRASYLSMMFQNPDLQFCMNTLRKELQFCMENICVPPTQMDERVEAAAKLLDVEHLLDRSLETLSGGEKQKAALCCLVVLDSRMIVLDEAFANIDTRSARQIMGYLRNMADQGKTVLAIDHRPETWKGIADRAIHFGAETEAWCEPPVKQLPSSENAIVLKNVTICRDRPLLECASAQFPKGCITAILGESGSGKTTLFQTILKQHPYTGSIEIEGKDLSKIKEKTLFSQIGVVFQNPGNQFITQNVLEEVNSSLRLWRKKETDTQGLLESYGLWQYRNYSPYMLSQGQQRRLAVLSVLCGGQKILLLDEPTYGQDAASTAAIMAQLRSKMEREDLTVVMITHDEALAKTWADRCYRLENRRLYED